MTNLNLRKINIDNIIYYSILFSFINNKNKLFSIMKTSSSKENQNNFENTNDLEILQKNQTPPQSCKPMTEDPHKKNENQNNSSFQVSVIDNKQNLSEDMINASIFDLNEFPATIPKLHQTNVELIQHLTESPFISNIIINLTESNSSKKDINGKIILSVFKENLYSQPFYFYYECNRITKALSTSQKLFNIRLKLSELKYNKKPDNNLNINCNFILNEIPTIEKICPNDNNIINPVHIGNKSISPAKNIHKDKPINSTNIDINNKQNEYERNKGNPLRVNSIANDNNMKSSINQSTNDNKICTINNNNQINSTSKKKKPFLKYNSSVINDPSILLNKSPSKNQKPQTTSKISRLYNGTKTKKDKIIPKETPLLNSANMTSLFLTKIPTKESKESNRQLDMAYSKAKDAARVVRRLEYSYNMKLSMMYSKPIHKKNAKLIQNWWKVLQFKKQSKELTKNIQKYIRGHLARRAYSNTMHVYKEIIPFLKIIDKIISRRLCFIYYHKLFIRYGLLKIHKLIKPKANLIIKNLNEYTKEMNLRRQIKTFNKKKVIKCIMIKYYIKPDLIDHVITIQSNVKRYLLRRTEKGSLHLAWKYHPYIYYYLKYGKRKLNGDIDYKQKLSKFNQIIKKLKEKKLKLNYNVNNCYEYLNYILKKQKWDEFKKYYLNNKNESNIIKKRKNEMKLNVKRKIWKDIKHDLYTYFTRWKLYNKSYENIIKPNLINKFAQIWLIYLYHKKIHEQIFLYKLHYIRLNQITNEKNILAKLINIYNRFNNSSYTKRILNYYLQRWRKIKQQQKLKSVDTLLNKFFKNSLNKIHKNKKQILLHIVSLYEKKFRNSFNNWRFENIKYKIQAHKLFQISKKKNLIKKRKFALKNNINLLNKRINKLERNAFKTFKINTGMFYRYSLIINTQIAFYHKNRKYFSLRKFRMLKYLVNKINNIKRINHWDKLKFEMLDIWKSCSKLSQMRKLIKKYAIKNEKIKNFIKLQKFFVWFRKMMLMRIKWRIWFLQNKIKKFINKKRKEIENKNKTGGS